MQQVARGDRLRTRAYSSCLLTGPGSASVIAALDDAGRRPRLLVMENDSPAEVLRGHVPAPERIGWTAGPADVAVAAKALAYRTDQEATLLLTRLADRTRTVVLVESSRPDGLSPHAAGAAPLSCTGREPTWRPPRTAAPGAPGAAVRGGEVPSSGCTRKLA